ncbi:MAG TPA: septal ring lytic transglycosylase RlpA family protein [Thermoanaerobaculia bacterium]|nr:septal ring lytic transglycosylase RlpA family protein [Thermoanaerobaculia bacterium]
MRRTRSVNAAMPHARRPWSLGIAALALLAYGGVAIQDAGRPAPPPEPSEPVVVTEAAPAAEWPTGPAHRGQASWYGSDFQGSPTASGEPFNMNALTAAHRSLPLGSYARVKNLDNGRSVVVRINDRGPHARRRTIDLSYAAAQEIAMVNAGTAPVEVAPLAR